MRGEASRIADRESRDSLAPKLRDTREDAWRIGNELFTIKIGRASCRERV